MVKEFLINLNSFLRNPPTSEIPQMSKNAYLTLAVVALCPVMGLAQYNPNNPYDPHNPSQPDQHWSPIYNGEGYDSPSAPYAVTDGNPLSATITAAQEAVGNSFSGDDMQEQFSEEPTTATEAVNTTSRFDNLGTEVGVGNYDINGMDASVYTVRVPFSYTISERGKMNFSIPLSVTKLKDVMAHFDKSGNLRLGNARVYGYGFGAAYTHKVFAKMDNVPYRWNVTPAFGMYLRKSKDMNLGTRVFNLGLSSSFAYQFAPGWVINMGNSISAAISSGFSGYPDPIRDSQQVAINGLQLIHMRGRLTLSVYVMDTRYFKTENTCVKSFQTYGTTCSFKLTQSRSIKASLLYESGDDLSAVRGTLGTTWQF